MVNKKLIIFLLIIGGLVSRVFAQENYNFTSLTTKNGISANTVNAILKDHYGFMWFATEDGLNRFDGINFRIYRHKQDDSTSLLANEILALHEDHSGNLWVGTSGGSLSLYDRKKDGFVHFVSNGKPNSISHNVIRSICSDYRGRIWVAHFNGVNILDPKTGKITDLEAGPNDIFRKTCSSIFEDSRHIICIGTNEGFYRYNPANGDMRVSLHRAEDATTLAGNVVSAIAEDKQGNLWIGTNNGLSMLQKNGIHFTNYHHDATQLQSISSDQVSAVAVDGENSLWIGTTKGLNIFDTRTGTITRLLSNERNVHSLTINDIASLYIDRQGSYWVGTYRGGVNKFDRNLNLFNWVQSNPFDPQGLQDRIVTSFAADGKAGVFVGTDGGGISLFNPQTNLFSQNLIPDKSVNFRNKRVILAMKMTKNNELLAGSFSEGLFIVNPATGSYSQLRIGSGDGERNSNDVFCIAEDHLGQRWLGTNGSGIVVLNGENKPLMRLTPYVTMASDILLPVNAFIRDILEDRSGKIWIATHGGGMAIYNPATKQFTIFNTDNSHIPNDKVLSILEDSKGNIWAGTFGGGLTLFNRRKNDFENFSEKNGLANNTIYKLVEDKSGKVWMSSNRGLSSIDIITKKINNYNFHHGLQNSNFVQGAGLCLPNGELYFGGLEGFNYFNPAYLKKNNNIPAVIITDLKISNESVTPSKEGPIKENISVATEINLDYKQNFALSFVGLNYTAPEQNEYSYQLEGFDKAWNNVGHATTASYTNLDPGTYTFRVKASNNDGVWSTTGASVTVHVRPPFWRTPFAYFFYILVIGCVLFYSRYKGIQKLKRKFLLEQQRAAIEQERKDAEHIHELDQLKIKFLTNLSHEFRTPISLILGPVDSLLAQDKSERAAGQLYMIKRNAKRLLNLVNQLLDFRKMEEQELHLQKTKAELVTFVKETADSFRDIADRKHIQFTVSCDIDKLFTYFDQDKLERILFNLLSNAFKFTLEKGEIFLLVENVEPLSEASETWVSFTVKDNGIGIPADKKDKIFERFFQHTTAASILNQGTGLGLSITREFVKMQGGTIEVESEPLHGTSFIVRLPFTPAIEPVTTVQAEIVPAETSEQQPQPPAEAEMVDAVETTDVDNRAAAVPCILLVEDNDDFRFYLKDSLRQHYRVIEAANGKEGWQKALAQHPSLIVSDINMPVMDGIELCLKIKSDKRTHHIPVILLTALTGEEDQLRGLGTGANDYISKPFNFEVLVAKIKNLLILNNTLKNTYSKKVKLLTPETVVESADEKLMATIMRYLEENLTNSQLSVDELSRHVGMSRSSLYSKLLDLTSQTPVEFIRSVKLEKAAVLLEKSDMTIAQVAYSVGFSTPNYFAKSFKSKFDLLPSEYISKHKKKNNSQN